ncbi:hypothetical protein HDU79_008641 [Rhizoclosmatium sp. JEL0117]|nr:hypothetical protein HDU79_008641 [Rhizoclosmatium sp. JEL0117]
MKQEVFHTGWIMEDTDLMPTVEDWRLVHNYFTNKGRSLPVLLSIDGDYHLRNYFQRSAVLRLVTSALGAHIASPKLPEQVSLSYYRRARKAVFATMSQEPQVETVQALFFLYLFAVWKGQPVIGRAFLKSGLEMIVALRLHIDPDDSTWLYSLNLSAREKEDRRRAFWASYKMYHWERSVSTDTFSFKISDGRMKPPSEVYDPQLIFSNCGYTKTESDLFEFLGDIKRIYALPPKSINELFWSDVALEMNERLLKLYGSIPNDTLLITESPQSMNQSDIDRFVQQLSIVSVQDVAFVFCINLHLFASFSILLRPKLYLSSLSCCNPRFLSTEKKMIIESAIKGSLDAANRIASLTSFFSGIANGKIQIPVHRGLEFFFRPMFVHVYPVFDAMIVFWLIKCRMDPAWMYVVGDEFGWDAVKKRVDGLMLFVGRLKSNQLMSGAEAGAMLPLYQCMEAMLREMEEMEGATSLKVGRATTTESDWDELVLGMNVISLDDVEKSCSREQFEIKEPQALLGLLGFQVGGGGGMRWRGRSEESWRLFWKLRC